MSRVCTVRAVQLTHSSSSSARDIVSLYARVHDSPAGLKMPHSPVVSPGVSHGNEQRDPRAPLGVKTFAKERKKRRLKVGRLHFRMKMSVRSSPVAYGSSGGRGEPESGLVDEPVPSGTHCELLLLPGRLTLNSILRHVEPEAPSPAASVV